MENAEWKSPFLEILMRNDRKGEPIYFIEGVIWIVDLKL